VDYSMSVEPHSACTHARMRRACALLRRSCQAVCPFRTTYAVRCTTNNPL
jgi:hypothetical protein